MAYQLDLQLESYRLYRTSALKADNTTDSSRRATQTSSACSDGDRHHNLNSSEKKGLKLKQWMT